MNIDTFVILCVLLHDCLGPIYMHTFTYVSKGTYVSKFTYGVM